MTTTQPNIHPPTASPAPAKPGVKDVMAGRSLKRRVYHSSAWSMGAWGINQTLHLASNLILTRLLFPEAFGLMALCSVFISIISLFSDFGLRTNIIQSKRGDDPRFLNTAWTIKVIKGFVLWGLVSAGAYPFALAYGEPMLAWMLPVIGFNAVIGGFGSTAKTTMSRHMALGRLTVVSTISLGLKILVMVGVALVWPSVWALVIGTTFSALFGLAVSHLYFARITGTRNRFEWDRQAFREIYRFGRWVLVTKLLGFMVSQGDKLILGAFMPTAAFGVYTIASMMANKPMAGAGQISGGAFFPAYSKLRHLPPHEMRKRLAKSRLVLMAIFLPLLWLLAITGESIINFLYDDRYFGAGWMTQVLVLGHIVRLSTHPGGFLFSRGNSFAVMILTTIQGAIFLTCMAVGGWFWGTPGLIWGVAITHLIYYPCDIVMQRRYGVWAPAVDMAGLLSSAVVIIAGLYLTGAL
ncbi:MAG: oligosaccharide flippase family protein [Phycisphaeraceae bacterium]